MADQATALERAAIYGVRALALLHVPGAAIHVIDEWTTLGAIRDRRASIARYGDGELEIMIGGGIYFQRADPVLARRLRHILRSPSPRFLVGIPNFDKLLITTESRVARWQRYRRLFSHLIRRGGEYHSMYVSRPAGIIGLESAEFFQAWDPVWAGRNIVVIHHSAATAEHPMFRSARSVAFVPCPAEHAFGEYADVFARASAHCSTPDVLFLIAAGPTACLLAFDLAQLGAQAIDIGHLTAACDEFTQKQ